MLLESKTGEEVVERSPDGIAKASDGCELEWWTWDKVGEAEAREGEGTTDDKGEFDEGKEVAGENREGEIEGGKEGKGLENMEEEWTWEDIGGKIWKGKGW